MIVELYMSSMCYKQHGAWGNIYSHYHSTHHYIDIYANIDICKISTDKSSFSLKIVQKVPDKKVPGGLGAFWKSVAP